MAFVFAASQLWAQASGVPKASEFDRNDRRAQEILASVRCAQSSSVAIRDGALGPLDSLGDQHLCVVQGGRKLVVFLHADSTFTKASNVTALVAGSAHRFTERLDTASVLAMSHAELTAHVRGDTKFEAENREYTPVTFRADGDSIEVWLIPISALMGPRHSVGGERGYVFSPDGRSLGSEIDASTGFRQITLPDSGVVRIVSSEAHVPTVSELVLANRMNGANRDISIEMRLSTATLVGRGSSAMWIRVAKHN